MARIRTVKPEFWCDEKLAPCSPITRLVFLGLISMADDCGRVVDNVKVIDAFIFPEDDSSTARRSLDELSTMARIKRGKTASGQRVIEIVNWKTHQKIDRPNMLSALPEIVLELVVVEQVTDIRRSADESSTTDRRQIDDVSSVRPTTSTYDLRPVPTTIAALPKKRATPSAKVPDEPTAHWVTDLHVWWTAHVGTIAPGELGKHAKPLRTSYSDPQIQDAALVYFSEDEGPRFRTPKDFFTNFATWHALANEPMVRDGDFTERAQRITARTLRLAAP